MSYRYTASIALSIAYDYDFRRDHDELNYAAVAEKAMEKLSGALYPGAMLVNHIPICIFLIALLLAC